MSEPLEVSQARKEMLIERRVKQKEMSDIECQLLIDCLQRSITKAEKKEIEGIVEGINRILKPFKKSEILTAQLSGVCRFFVKRSERGNFDPAKPYPYTFHKPTARELYPEITSDDIKNYKPTETLRVSEGRLLMLEEKWREGAMTIPLAEKLIGMLRKNLTEERIQVERFISKRSLLFRLPWAMLSPNQQTESKLLGVCDYIITTNKERQQSIKQGEAVKAKRSSSPPKPASKLSATVPKPKSRSNSPRRRSPRRRSRSRSRSSGKSKHHTRRRSRTPPRRRSRSPARRWSRTPPRRRSRSRSRRRSRSRSRRRSRSRSRRRSRSRSRRRTRSRSRRRSFSPPRRRRRSRSLSPRARSPRRVTPPRLGMLKRELEALARDDPHRVLRMRKEGKIGNRETEDALCAIKGTLTWDEQETFERMMKEGPFVKEYRTSPFERKLTIELEVLCTFLAHIGKKVPEPGKEEIAPKGIATKALKQVKDQAKRDDIEKQISSQLEIVRSIELGSAAVDRKSCMEATLPEGAVGEVIQEIQRQTQLLDAEPRDLPHQMILMPHEHEPDFVARARFAIFLEDRQYGRLNDQQAARVLEDIKINLPQDEKDLISKICLEENKRLVDQDSTCMTKSFELTVALKVTCEYFLRRSQKLPHPDDVYPYAHLIGSENDSHIQGISRNGQYKEIPVSDRPTYHTHDLHECIKILADQNNVQCSFNVEKVQGSLHNAVVTLGSSTYMGESVTSADEAQQNAAYDALLKTYYAFFKIPQMLRNFKHNRDVRRTIVRSVNPLRSAGAMTQILADQNKVTKRYKTERDGLMYRSTLLLGNKVYKGSGISAEIAQNLADYFAIQQSSYDFTTPPPGVAKGTSVNGEGFNKVSAEPQTLLDNRNSKDSSLGDNLTYLVTEELKQSAKLMPKEYAALNRRIHQLPERIPCEAGCIMAEVERYIEFSSQAQRKKFMTNGKKRVMTYMEAEKMCSVSSILEETKEAHADVLKILKSPVGEIITPCDKLKSWTSLKRTKELQWTCELIDLKKSGKPLTSEWLQAMTPKPRKLPTITPVEKRKSASAAKTNPTTASPQKQGPMQTENANTKNSASSKKPTEANTQKPKENTIVPTKFPFEMSTMPLIPIFEQIQSTVVPVKDRATLMECRVGQLLNKRKINTISDSYLMSVINSIKGKLPAKDIVEVDKLTRQAEPSLPPGTDISVTDIASKLNHQFKVLSTFVIEKLAKQTTVVSASRYHEIMRTNAAVDPWGIVPPASVQASVAATGSGVQASSTVVHVTEQGKKPQTQAATSSVAQVAAQGKPQSSAATNSVAHALQSLRNAQKQKDAPVPADTSNQTPAVGSISSSTPMQNVPNPISKDSEPNLLEASSAVNVIGKDQTSDSCEVDEQVQQFYSTVSNLESSVPHDSTVHTIVPDNTVIVTPSMEGEREDLSVVDDAPVGGGVIVIEPIGLDDPPIAENYDMPTAAAPTGPTITDTANSGKNAAHTGADRRISLGESGAVVEPAMILSPSTDNVKIRIVRKDDGSTELVVQTMKEDDGKGYESATLPWIPALEPTDLTSAPVEERFRAMQAKVTEILSNRDTSKLNTKETTDIMKSIRAKLSKEDLNEVKVKTDEAVKVIPPDLKIAPGAWKMTQRLNVLCRFVLCKLGVPDIGNNVLAGPSEVSTEETESTPVTGGGATETTSAADRDGNMNMHLTNALDKEQSTFQSGSIQIVHTVQPDVTPSPLDSTSQTDTSADSIEAPADTSVEQKRAEIPVPVSRRTRSKSKQSPIVTPTTRRTRSKTAAKQAGSVSTSESPKAKTATGQLSSVPTIESTQSETATPQPLIVPTIESTQSETATPQPPIVPTIESTQSETATPQPPNVPTIENTQSDICDDRAQIQPAQADSSSSQSQPIHNAASSSQAKAVSSFPAQTSQTGTSSTENQTTPNTSQSNQPQTGYTSQSNLVQTPSSSQSQPAVNLTAGAQVHSVPSFIPQVQVLPPPPPPPPPPQKIEYPLRSHTVGSSKEVPISDEITLPDQPVPWIPEFEPRDFTRSPVQERFEALKASIMDLLNQRKNYELSDPDTSRMVQTVIGRLDKRDVERLDTVRNKVIKYKGHSPEARPFILTQQLQMICFYLLQRVEKQPETEQKKTVSKWLQTKSDEYYQELEMFCLTNAAIKERSEALQLQLSDVQKKSVAGMVKEECVVMKKRFVWDSQVSFLTNVISLELTCLYIQWLAKDSQDSIQCTLTKKFAEILLDKKKVCNMDPFDSEDAVRVVKKSLGAESETEKSEEKDVMDLETSEHSGPSVPAVGPKQKIKLTLSSAKK